MDYFERQVVVQYNLVYRANLFVIRLVTKNRLSSNRVIYMMMKLSLSRTANTKKQHERVLERNSISTTKEIYSLCRNVFFYVVDMFVDICFPTRPSSFHPSLENHFYSGFVLLSATSFLCQDMDTFAPYIAQIQNRTKSQLSLLKYSRKTNHATGMYCSKAFNWVARHFFPYIECQNHNC